MEQRYNGYIKLHRKTIESEVFVDPLLFKLWSLCLMLANHKYGYVDIERLNRPVKVNPGQFITGRFSLHEKFYPRKRKKNKSPLTLWRKLEILQNIGNLNIETHTTYSIITIHNWKLYQQNEQRLNNERTTTEQRLNTNKNVEECIKNVKKKNIYTSNFLSFWNIYPRKTGKGAAFKAYQNIKQPKPTLNEILQSIETHQQSDQWQNTQFIPNPSTWLNQRRWEDEVEDESIEAHVNRLYPKGNKHE